MKSKNKLDKFLILSWKKVGLLILLWIISVLIHNFSSALLGFEEALFFIIAVFLIPIYFIISIGYTIYRKIKTN